MAARTDWVRVNKLAGYTRSQAEMLDAKINGFFVELAVEQEELRRQALILNSPTTTDRMLALMSSGNYGVREAIAEVLKK